MSKNNFAPVHPGEILAEEYMKAAGLSANRLAIELRVTPARINEIVRGERAITADTALRLARFFETSAAMWMDLQTRYDLETAQEALGKKLKRDIHPLRETA